MDPQPRKSVPKKSEGDTRLTERDLFALAGCDSLVALGDHTFTPTELGEHLWPETAGYRMRQSMARPAGKVIARLVRAGYVKATERRQSDGTWRHAYTRTSKEAS